MDFDKLHTFFEVARIGSITEAAKSLGMDKSSISRQLSILEQQVEKKLFERYGNKLVLTPSGDYLFAKARHILMEIEATRAELLSEDKLVKGSLTITATHAVTSTWLTHFLNKFIVQYPDIFIHIKASNQPLNLSLKEADVAILPYYNAPDQDDFIQKHLRSWRLRLYASKDYLKKFGTPQTPDDLDRHRLLIFGDTHTVYSYQHTHWPLTLKISKGKTRKEFLIINSIEGMTNLMCKGVGVGNRSDCAEAVKDLVPVLADQMYYDVHAYLIYHRQFVGVKIVMAFEKFLMDHIKNTNVQEIL